MRFCGCWHRATFKEHLECCGEPGSPSNTARRLSACFDLQTCEAPVVCPARQGSLSAVDLHITQEFGGIVLNTWQAWHSAFQKSASWRTTGASLHSHSSDRTHHSRLWNTPALLPPFAGLLVGYDLLTRGRCPQFLSSATGEQHQSAKMF